MVAKDSPDLLAFLSSFVSDHKKALFEEVLQWRTRHLTVVLENIYQPQNASAVLRTCELLGIQDVHIIEDKNPFHISPTVTQGSAKWLSLHRYSNKEAPKECLTSLMDSGYHLVCASPHAKKELYELDTSQPLGICFGTEHIGASKEMLAACNEQFKIPMFGFTESYNLSVSVAIVLFDITQRLRNAGGLPGLSEAEKNELRILWSKRSIKRPEDLERYFYKKWPSNEDLSG